MEKNFSEWLAAKEMNIERVEELKNHQGKPVLLWIHCKNYYQKAMAMIELQSFFYKGGQPNQGIIVWDDLDEGQNCMQFRGNDRTVDKLLKAFKFVGSRGFFNEKLGDYDWKAVQADVPAVRAYLSELMEIID